MFWEGTGMQPKSAKQATGQHIGIALALAALVFLSSITSADVYINSRTGNIDFNANGSQRAIINSIGNFGVSCL